MRPNKLGFQDPDLMCDHLQTYIYTRVQVTGIRQPSPRARSKPRAWTTSPLRARMWHMPLLARYGVREAILSSDVPRISDLVMASPCPRPCAAGASAKQPVYSQYTPVFTHPMVQTRGKRPETQGCRGRTRGRREFGASEADGAALACLPRPVRRSAIEFRRMHVLFPVLLTMMVLSFLFPRVCTIARASCAHLRHRPARPRRQRSLARAGFLLSGPGG